MAAGIPIVPIVIRNAEIVAARNSTTINPGTVDVAVFPPISVQDWTLDTLEERIAGVRQLYLDTLANWPVDELPEVDVNAEKKAARKARAQPAAKAAAKKAPAKKAAAKKAAAKAPAKAKKAAAKTKPVQANPSVSEAALKDGEAHSPDQAVSTGPATSESEGHP
jgi:putative phosphoserine phosphatase/1-acylglycerol-3-phosphate O-acyltransferase